MMVVLGLFWFPSAGVSEREREREREEEEGEEGRDIGVRDGIFVQ